jgi:hypothetical protein
MWYRRLEALRTSILCEVSSQLAVNAAENTKYIKEKTLRPKRFIRNSSLIGNKAGMRRESATYCVGLGFTVCCIHSKHWECACNQAHPCVR